MPSPVFRLIISCAVVCVLASAAPAQPADKTTDAVNAPAQKSDEKSGSERLSQAITLVVAIGGWVLALFTLYWNKRTAREERAEANKRLEHEQARSDQRLNAEKQDAEAIRAKQQASADGARIESYLVSSLDYFSHGSRNRSIGLALIEAHWDDPGFARLRKVWTPILVGQTLYLLAGPDAKARQDPHEVDNLRRIISLLRSATLSEDERQALKSCAASFIRPTASPELTAVVDGIRDLSAAAAGAAPVGAPAPPSPPPAAPAGTLAAPAPPTPQTRSSSMKELFSDLITTLTSDGPDHPRVDQIIEKMRQAKAPPEAIADALATRSAWRRSRGEEPKPAAAAEEDSARLTSRPGFDKEVEALNAYTEGKMKRYSLLFTVNGAAFAIAKLLAPRAGAEPPEPAVLGGLQLHHLAVGACVFTVLMCLDIWMYGRMMRKNYFAGAFGLAGKIVLCMMGAVLVAGWGLAAYR